MQRLEEEILMKQRAEAEGRAKGMKQGMKQGILSSAQNLMRTTGMSAVQALSAIGVGQENLEEYIGLLETSISTEK